MSGIAMVVRRHVSADVSEEEIQEALRKTDNSTVSAIHLINGSRRISVKKILTNTGVRISTHIEQADSEGLEDDHLVRKSKPIIHVDKENDEAVLKKTIDPSKMTFDEFLQATGTKVMETQDFLKSQVKAETVKETQVAKTNSEPNAIVSVKEEPKEFVEDKSVDGSKAIVVVKEPYMGVENLENKVSVKEEPIDETKAIVVYKESQFGVETKAKVPVKEEPVYESKAIVVVKEEPLIGVQNNFPVKEETVGYQSNQPKLYDDYKAMRENLLKRSRETPSLPKPSNVKKERVENQSALIVSVEDGDFAEEPDWYLVGRTAVTALSTSKGRKLVDNEIVHFSFPSPNSRFNSQWIVRFSTKRFGEIGRLPMEWGKCVVPLVHSGKVKVLGRCIVAPTCLSMMQEIMLYVSFYIHHSIFTEGDKSSWRFDISVNLNSTIYPLLTLFKLLKIKPYLKAEFTPEELDSRKRRLNLDGDSNETLSALPAIKRRNGCSQIPEQNKDEQAISESSLNKLVGAAETYDLEEMEPPNTLTCDLRPYQKQALYWMSELEKGIDAERASKTLHPCWAAYRICDERASSIYVNIFSGEATTLFPTATQMARGGILADAMGLGKTVMTIALILTKPGRKSSQKINSPIDGAYKPKGGTLVVCPLSLLSQWKEELETHSKTDTLSIFVHYGGEKANNSMVISDHDVVLTTYGVLTSAYKYEREESIFHRVDWYRVVLDEAHTIKSWKSLAAQAAYSLSSHCRWCLTGTPLQNNLEDLYSLLCFLHVEPWCNWAWWSKLIQRPYENGDSRGLKLIKAILRPMMLRRTKETRDKEGRPIIILPPTDIQIIECQQSEAERDFYDALFKRSKVQFDQFVAQGKVLHNYANILELLLRLRQCCDHPYLVMSRGDNQKYADLNKLARRFLEINPDSTSSNHNGPSAAYIEEVVDGIRRGENTECPICMESADDPVLTPCAHRMCRECLLSSWRSPATGLCPICRQVIKKTELITCPSESRFQIDIEKNWKESSKVLKLLECLEQVHYRGSDEKSIIFSQFTAFMDLLEIPLKNRRIGFLRFDGKLSQKNREKVLKEFSENKGVKVLLMSLRAGGVGLNLTAASNVFLMDPWWNPAVEEQAIMRIHRIGQKRTVHVRRFIVKDSVEERLQQVQARKQRMIAGALTDEEVRSARIEELKMLFR